MTVFIKWKAVLLFQAIKCRAEIYRFRSSIRHNNAQEPQAVLMSSCLSGYSVVWCKPEQ